MESSINSKMAVIGVTYQKIYRPIQRYFGIYLQWRAEGVLDRIMNLLHEQVRKQVKKKTSMDNSDDH